MQTVSALEDHVGFWLRFVSNHVSQSFAQRLAASGVTVAEWVILRSLYEVESVSPSALAETVGMTRGAISKLVDRLLLKGLLSREGRNDDRRFQTVALTRQGRELVPKLSAIADANDATFFASLSERDYRTLVATLKKLVTANDLKRVPTD